MKQILPRGEKLAVKLQRGWKVRREVLPVVPTRVEVKLVRNFS
jgi:hypothetical protein